MGMKKSTALTADSPIKGEIPVTRSVEKTESKPESGAVAAIARLKTAKPVEAKAVPSTSGYKPRDFDAEARGKTRCVQFEAALMSPAIAGLKFDTLEQFLALVEKAAEAGVRYTFQDK